MPFPIGADLRGLPWQDRRDRLELLARAFDVPLELSPLVEPSVSLVTDMTDGRLEGTVLKDRTSTYRDGTRAGWTKQGPQLVRAGGVALRPTLGSPVRLAGAPSLPQRRYDAPGLRCWLVTEK